MTKNPDMDIWLDISGALFRSLLPKGSGYEMCGKGMDPEVFASLVDRETAHVKKALLEMAEAENEQAVLNVVAGLKRDTLICLFSRWAHCMAEWKKYLDDKTVRVYMPPDGKDLWRAVFLVLADDPDNEIEISLRLWPEWCVVPHLECGF